MRSTDISKCDGVFFVNREIPSQSGTDVCPLRKSCHRYLSHSSLPLESQSWVKAHYDVSKKECELYWPVI